MLELDDCYVPRPFAQWVADNISTKDEAIVLRGKLIPLNPKVVSLVLGIPAGRTKIGVLDEVSTGVSITVWANRSSINKFLRK